MFQTLRRIKQTLEGLPRRWWMLCRWGIAALAYGLLLKGISGSAVLGQVSLLDGYWSCLAITLPVVGIGLSARRWQIVLRRFEVRRPYPELLLRYWQGAFYNSMLPGSISGDAVRIGALVRSGVPLTTVVGSTIIDRLLGLWVSILIGLLGTLWLPVVPQRGWLVAIFAAIVVGGLVLFFLAPRLANSPRIRPRRLVRLLDTYRGGLSVHLLLLTTVFQVLVALNGYAVAQALHLPMSIAMCSVYIPAVTLVTLLPISLNGIGLREVTFVVLLAPSGISPASAILFGGLFYLTTLCAVLPGGLAAFALRPRGAQMSTHASKSMNSDPASNMPAGVVAPVAVAHAEPR